MASAVIIGSPSTPETKKWDSESPTEDNKKMRFKIPKMARSFLAELFGTFALVLLGDGAVAQVVLGKGVMKSDFFGGFLNIAFGYGFALMVGILISGGVSGGHLNPAVTVSMASLKKIRLIEVPVYMAGQYIGAFLGALVLWGAYADAIRITEEGDNYTKATFGIFASYPFSEEFSLVTLAMDQMLGTAILVVIILAVTDSRNMQISSSLVPLLIGLGLTSIHLSFGLNAGSAINPARDFSPRLLTVIAGWGTEPFKAFSYWFWIPWLLPHIGGLIGGLFYTILIELNHPDDELKL